ncbi:helix-turn-helix transcriptional regulator [Salsuginibacillus halophilus]
MLRLSLMLKEVRGRKQMSLKTLEKKTGVSSPYIFRLEQQDRKNPSVQAVLALCKAMELTSYEVFQLLLEDYHMEGYVPTLEELLRSHRFALGGNEVDDVELKRVLLDIVMHIDQNMDEDVEQESVAELTRKVERYHDRKAQILSGV